VKKIYILIYLYLIVFSNEVFGSKLHELRLIYVTQKDNISFDINQKLYYSKKKNIALVREHDLFLPVFLNTEIGFSFSYLNQVQPEITISRAGDIKLFLNTRLDWVKNTFTMNYFLEYNNGSGPQYTSINAHPMESYGFPEIRTGFLFFKNFNFISFHLNLFYVFRKEKIIREKNENNEFVRKSIEEPGITNGMTLNIFSKDTYYRVFGFNYSDERNFFYYRYLSNDNLEYLLAANTDLIYPYVPFIEFTFNHDFQIKNRKARYYKYAPGSGYFKFQAAAGFKILLVEDSLRIKSSFFIPIGELKNAYIWGTSLGFQFEF